MTYVGQSITTITTNAWDDNGFNTINYYYFMMLHGRISGLNEQMTDMIISIAGWGIQRFLLFNIPMESMDAPMMLT